MGYLNAHFNHTRELACNFIVPCFMVYTLAVMANPDLSALVSSPQSPQSLALFS